MSEESKTHKEVHAYPDDELRENYGPPVHPFLKLSYTGAVIFAVVYFVLYVNGDGAPLVKLFNKMISNQ